MTCQILAGPRLDSLRFALLDEAGILSATFEHLDVLRRGFFELKQNGRSVPNAFHWGPVEMEDMGCTEHAHLSLWSVAHRQTRALDPFGLLAHNGHSPASISAGSDSPSDFADVSELAVCRLDLSRSGYLASFHSPPDGPGYLAIKDFGNRASSAHPVQFDLAASWLWNFSSALDAAEAAAIWWARAGVLNESAALALLGDYSTHRVTRADVCVDHTLSPSEAWSREDLDRFAGRAKARGFAWLAPPRDAFAVDAQDRSERKTRRRELYSGPRSFTLYIGCRSATFLRVYDKTAELGLKVETSPAADVWRRNGWDGVSRVWRAEVQICSKSLQYLNTNWGEPMRQLHALCPRQLWALYCESMRHVDLDASRLSRCSTSPRWQVLQDAAGDNEPAHRSAIEAKAATVAGCLRLLDQALKRCLVEGAHVLEVRGVVEQNYILDLFLGGVVQADGLKSTGGDSEAPKSLS